MTDPGYAFVIDNVQWLAHAGHAGKENKNKMHLVCNGYAAKNRVSCRHLTDEVTKKASEIPLTDILPSQADFESLKERMEVIVQRILVKNLKCFEEVAEAVEQHIPHQYSAESAQKTECVSIDINYILLLYQSCSNGWQLFILFV